jgi:sugar phosphate isomerase/epimerase
MLIADDQDYNDKGLSALFKYAYNISHVKDSENDRGKVYTVDMNNIFEIAKRNHYRGFFSMEFEGTGDPYQGTASLIRKSLESLA